jgi:hydroxymethylpyrimidine pyrophosphatase-like HAD family hydrolase
MKKFLVLALDFDGTIAQNDVLDGAVREAIAKLRSQGIVVAIVTGRILEDLRRVCGDLHFVDAVIAENGAVIEFPASGCRTTLAPRPPAAFLTELKKVGIPHAVGQSVVEADASEACAMLAVLQRLELPLVLAFNRGRVMVLPQAISKATGLKQALAILRLSVHNAMAIGDAENDHELLGACEVGVAVAWGSEVLKGVADYVLSGDGPPAVAAYIREIALGGYLPVPVHTRRNLLLGHTDDGQPLALAVRGRNVLIAGDPKSGKSWVTGLLCEQLILYGYSLCILDPEGDYTALEALPGVTVFGGADPLPRPREVVRALRHSDVSVVIDLSHSARDEKLQYMRSMLPALATLRRRTGLPHRIVVDEAHYFLQEPGSELLKDFDLGGYTLVTYRASGLDKNLLAASQAVIVTRESDPEEISALRALCTTCQSGGEDREWGVTLERLVIGEAVALPITEEAHGEARRIHLAPRLTPHVRHMAKYIDLPVSENRSFVFWSDGAPTGQRAQTLREFVDIIGRASLLALDGHLRRKDFSRWIGGVFGDYELSRIVSALEDNYLSGRGPSVAGDLSREIRARYDCRDEFEIGGRVLSRASHA